jgi:UDP-N-acetylglucosamine 4,6-dehydratase/5-epimerase
MLQNLKFKRIFLTGGTGSFGTAFVSSVLKNFKNIEIVIYSRDELKQFEMDERFKSPNLRFILGDVRDADRLVEASKNCDLVVHAAAMKQIVASERNPLEAIKTNVLGASNVIDAALSNGISKVIALSTDKAANPINLYGATKLCSDKLFISANYLPGNVDSKFSVVRYGNVLGSRGSVIPFFKLKTQEGEIPITDVNMTRFWITLDQSVSFVLSSINMMLGGEIFVPRIPSFKITDVARVVAPGVPTRVIGIRPGEKLHEIMITEDDAMNTMKLEDRYVILSPELKLKNDYAKLGEYVPSNFKYSSDLNDLWFTEKSFTELLKSIEL